MHHAAGPVHDVERSPHQFLCEHRPETALCRIRIELRIHLLHGIINANGRVGRVLQFDDGMRERVGVGPGRTARGEEHASVRCGTDVAQPIEGPAAER